MSADSEWSEFTGYSEWPGVETSEEGIEYPDPLPVAGAIVRCPTCSWVGAEAGFPSHHRRTHIDPTSSR